MSSNPIDSRTVPGPMSDHRCCSVVKPFGFCKAGGTTSDSVEPRLAAIENNSSASAKRDPASSPPATSIVTMVPKSGICLSASAWPGSLGRPG